MLHYRWPPSLREPVEQQILSPANHWQVSGRITELIAAIICTHCNSLFLISLVIFWHLIFNWSGPKSYRPAQGMRITHKALLRYLKGSGSAILSSESHFSSGSSLRASHSLLLVNYGSSCIIHFLQRSQLLAEFSGLILTVILPLSLHLQPLNSSIHYHFLALVARNPRTQLIQLLPRILQLWIHDELASSAAARNMGAHHAPRFRRPLVLRMAYRRFSQRVHRHILAVHWREELDETELVVVWQCWD